MFLERNENTWMKKRPKLTPIYSKKFVQHFFLQRNPNCHVEEVPLIKHKKHENFEQKTWKFQANFQAIFLLFLGVTENWITEKIDKEPASNSIKVVTMLCFRIFKNFVFWDLSEAPISAFTTCL